MSIPFSSSYKLERLAPAAPHGNISFDTCQFGDRMQHHAVHAEVDGEGDWKSTGISFEDYGRMGSFAVAPTYRYKPTPVYATDPTAMRKLLVRFCERRAWGGCNVLGGRLGPGLGTDAERLERALTKIRADVPRIDALTTSLCARYLDAKKNGADPAVLRKMASQIETHDSRLRMAREAPAIFVGVIYRSYCLSENSVDVGAALGIKPNAVRQLLTRFAFVWERMLLEESATAAAISGRQTAIAPVQRGDYESCARS